MYIFLIKQVVDHETWIFNLTEANANGDSQTPKWFKEYEFSAEFTENLSPAGINTLLNEMAENPDILRKVQNVYFINIFIRNIKYSLFRRSHPSFGRIK